MSGGGRGQGHLLNEAYSESVSLLDVIRYLTEALQYMETLDMSPTYR